MAVGAIVGAVVGIGTSIAGSQKAASASRKAGRAQAEASRLNSELFLETAEFNKMAGKRKFAKFERESQIFMGNQVSRFAKAGVDMTGSPLMQQVMTQERVNMQLEDIRQETEFNVRIANLRARGATAQADNAIKAGKINSSTALLTGTGSAARGIGGLFGGGS
jgi:hypothetical protein